MIKQPLMAYYRCPEEYLDFCVAAPLQGARGYFHFGPDLTCYGHTSGSTCPTVQGPLFDAAEHVRRHGATSVLPFDPAQVVDNLRYERYVDPSGQQRWMERAWIKHTYYLLRPLFPVALRKHVQQLYLCGWETLPFPAWPVDRSVDRLVEKLLMLAMHARHLDRLPFIWFWPAGHAACAIVTHDVEAPAGRDFTSRLMDIDEAFGIQASFQIVPEKRYAVSPAYLDAIRERGFEINVQGLDHDGNLFENWETFLKSAQKINHYATHFGARGFRSPIMYRKADWFKYLCFSYDMSVPNVAHLEPQRGSGCTVMPSFLPSGMLELPLTTI